MKADVESEFYESRIEVLSASLKGTVKPEEEILILGHLCHPYPSANDNASGSGGMMEMARALRRMIDKGLILPPKRTIRFLWVPEFNGTAPYILSHREQMKKTLAAFNCDMIGEDLHITGGYLEFTRTPYSLPSFLNDVTENFAELAASLNLVSINGSRHPFMFRISPFGPGSDHYVLNDSAVAVPSMMVGKGDIFHHTSLDTPEKTDSTELRRICFIVLGTSVYLASAGDGEADEIVRLITGKAVGRLAGEHRRIQSEISGMERPNGIHDAADQGLNILRHSEQREIETLLSTSILMENPGRLKEFTGLQLIRDICGKLRQDIEQNYISRCRDLKTVPGIPKITKREAAMKKLIPSRRPDFIGPTTTEYLQLKLGEKGESEVLLHRLAKYEALCFADGKKSIYDIWRAVSAEYGIQNIDAVYLFFQLMEKAGIVTITSR